MEFTSEEGEREVRRPGPGGRRDDRRPGLRRHPGPDRRRTRPQAHIHPEAGEVLVDLAAQVLAVAVVTGRPARQALDLGGLEQVGNAIGDAGKELYLFGQYGNERWSSTNRRVIGPRPPHGLATFIADLPRLLRRLGRGGRAHRGEGAGRRGAHPAAGRPRPRPTTTLLPAIREEAGRARPGGRARQAGDRGALGRHAQGDRGRPAGRGARRRGLPLHRGRPRRRRGVRGGAGAGQGTGCATLLVCSADSEESALHPLSDVLVHGPEGVLDLLRQLTTDAAALRAWPPVWTVRPDFGLLRDSARPTAMTMVGCAHARPLTVMVPLAVAVVAYPFPSGQVRDLAFRRRPRGASSLRSGGCSARRRDADRLASGGPGGYLGWLVGDALFSPQGAWTRRYPRPRTPSTCRLRPDRLRSADDGPAPWRAQGPDRRPGRRRPGEQG